MSEPINQEHEDVLNFAHSLPSGLTKEQIYVRIHERARALPAAEQPADFTNATITGGEVDGNRVFVNMDERPSTHLWTTGKRCYIAPSAPAAAQEPESQPAAPTSSDEFEDQLDRLITEVSNASHRCGEHNIDEDEEGYEPILNAAYAAEEKLRNFVRAVSRAALAAPVPAVQEGARADEHVKVAQALQLCADDPMWAKHAEVSKATLRRAADLLTAFAWRPNDGRQPVPNEAMVEVCFARGGESEIDRAENWNWECHVADEWNIVKWRLAPAMEAPSHE